jgi:cobalamin biosynthesis protein CobC
MTGAPRDHGGGIDGAIARHGGTRAGWLDLSTGINPVPYRLPALPADAWTALPDKAAHDALIAAARRFWRVPDGAAVLAANGASALIAALPPCVAGDSVHIPGPTYNEHAAAFAHHGWRIADDCADVLVVVHPNNPDGRIWGRDTLTHHPVRIIDESFGDVMPDASLIAEAATPGTVILKSFGKFWGLAGVRLGFAIGDPQILARLGAALGPWAVSGPALAIGAAALKDTAWADTTRARLAQDTARLDDMIGKGGASLIGGTSLFRLYTVDDAAAWQDRLARAHVWSRIFPYSRTWLRLGLPAPDRWHQLEAAF